MRAAPYRENAYRGNRSGRDVPVQIVLMRVPVYLRLHIGFFALMVFALGYALVALLERDARAFWFALAMAAGSPIVNRVIEWFGGMEEDSNASIRVGSVVVEPRWLILSLFGRVVRTVEASAGLEALLSVGWQCVRAADARAVKALARGSAVWAPLMAPPRADAEVFLDASTWICSNDEMWTDTCFVAVIDGETLVFLPDGEATWRAALEMPNLEGLEDTRAATLGRLLAWLPQVHRRAVLARCSGVSKAQAFTREEARRAERRGLHVHFEVGPTLTLTASESVAWERWIQS